jgi:hypothetical protein
LGKRGKSVIHLPCLSEACQAYVKLAPYGAGSEPIDLTSQESLQQPWENLSAEFSGINVRTGSRRSLFAASPRTHAGADSQTQAGADSQTRTTEQIHRSRFVPRFVPTTITRTWLTDMDDLANLAEHLEQASRIPSPARSVQVESRLATSPTAAPAALALTSLT